MRSTSLLSLALLASLGSPASAPAQVPPGQYLACARVPGGEMYVCNPQNRQVTLLTTPANFATDWANCVWMDNPVTGFVGTFNNPSVYAITLAGSTLTATLLNTAALAGANECTQLVRIGNTIYVAQWDKLSSIPVAGGAPTLELDLTTLTGWPSGGIANAIATDGVSKIYLCIWTGGQVYVFDTVTKAASLLTTLPASKYTSATTFSPVNAQMKFPAPLGQLVIASLNGDVLQLDTVSNTVKQHWYVPTAVGASQSPSKDALVEIRDTGDWAIGTRDGAIDLLVPVGADGQLARRDIEGIGTGSIASPLTSRVVGLWYNNASATYFAFGKGCPGSGGYFPTSVGRGPATRGNASFAFGLDGVNGNGLAALVLGVNNAAPYPLDLTPLGAPGCFLRNDFPIVLGTTATGTGPGLGWASVPVPLPNVYGTVFTQWISVDATVNALGVVMSDARQLTL